MFVSRKQQTWEQTRDSRCFQKIVAIIVVLYDSSHVCCLHAYIIVITDDYSTVILYWHLPFPLRCGPPLQLFPEALNPS